MYFVKRTNTAQRIIKQFVSHAFQVKESVLENSACNFSELSQRKDGTQKGKHKVHIFINSSHKFRKYKICSKR